MLGLKRAGADGRDGRHRGDPRHRGHGTLWQDQKTVAVNIGCFPINVFNVLIPYLH